MVFKEAYKKAQKFIKNYRCPDWDDNCTVNNCSYGCALCNLELKIAQGKIDVIGVTNSQRELVIATFFFSDNS